MRLTGANLPMPEGWRFTRAVGGGLRRSNPSTATAPAVLTRPAGSAATYEVCGNSQEGVVRICFGVGDRAGGQRGPETRRRGSPGRSGADGAARSGSSSCWPMIRTPMSSTRSRRLASALEPSFGAGPLLIQSIADDRRSPSPACAETPTRRLRPHLSPHGRSSIAQLDSRLGPALDFASSSTFARDAARYGAAEVSTTGWRGPPYGPIATRNAKRITSGRFGQDTWGPTRHPNPSVHMVVKRDALCPGRTGEAVVGPK